MNLHEYKDDFRQLCTLAAAYKHIPESAVRRDYHIVMMLKNLAESEYARRPSIYRRKAKSRQGYSDFH